MSENRTPRIPGVLVAMGLGVIWAAWNSAQDYPVSSGIILLGAVAVVAYGVSRLLGKNTPQ